jgi:hypothetical protein
MKYTLLLLRVSLKLLAQEKDGGQTSPTLLPSELINDRFFLKIPTNNRDTIMGYCDTGGGFTALYQVTAKKFRLENVISQVTIKGESTQYIKAADIYSNAKIPYPAIANYYRGSINEPFFEVPENNAESTYFLQLVPHDVFLGQFFFINESWTFNYLTKELYVHTPLHPALSEANTQELGFKKDKNGKKLFGHPSIKLEINDKSIDFLFDTGAMFLLSATGKKELGITENSIGGSFIAKSIFDLWRKEHPEWRFIPKGELNGADMIEVPEIRVGVMVAGPVWFSKRPDEAWSKGMIGSMDKVVKGAIGGSFLKYFKVTIDYNSELIQFEK